MLFYPVYIFLCKRLKIWKHFASAITIMLIFLFIIIPIAFFLAIISNQAISFYQQVVANKEVILSTIKNIESSTASNGYINTHILNLTKNIDWTKQITEFVQFISNFLISGIQRLSSNMLYTFFILFIMFYTMYYLLLDGESMLKSILDKLPLGNALQKKLIDKFYHTTRSTIIATAVVGILEGVISTIIFSIADVPSALFWGLMVFLFSIIPAIGANAVWIPVGFVKLMVSPPWQGAFILISCFIIITFIDYIIRPKLIGKDSALHPMVVMFATLGGLIAFGLPGFILGPIIAALFIVVWEVFGQAFTKQLKTIKKD